MDVIHERVAGLDVHKASIMACVRTTSGGKIKRECRTFETTTAALKELLAWLTECRCTHVAMEATGVFWKPVWNILSDGGFELIRRPIIAHPVADEPIRLVFIDLELPNWRAELQQLARLITPSGCVAFDGVRDEADVEAAHAEMLRAHLAWNEIGRVGTLRVYKKA